MAKHPHLLIIGYVWPEPDSSAAGQRMMQLIKLFQENGWRITFASSSSETAHSVKLENMGVKTAGIEVNSSSFDNFIGDLQPDAVLFDRFVIEEQFGWRVTEQCPEALQILDTEDLHCLRRARKEVVGKSKKFHFEDLLTDKTAFREVASIYRSDISLIISETEIKLLTNLFGVDERLLHYLPFLVEPITTEDVNNWLSFEDRKHFVSIGNFRHPPNRDAVQYLKEKIWPHIRKQIPEAQMHIYGAYPSQADHSLHKPQEGFRIKGRAEDAQKVVSGARVLLAPLRFGAGLKGKLLEAMQCGTPSITTPIGAEGLQGNFKWPGAVVTKAEDLAAEAVAFYTDRDRWEEARERGAKIINRRFSGNHFRMDFINLISDLRENIAEHRRRNFVVGMLRHHTTAGTKYMSKWIEEKNKRKSKPE